MIIIIMTTIIMTKIIMATTIMTQIIMTSISLVQVVLSMLGKLAITSAYGTVYIFSAELFPTRVGLLSGSS